MACLPECLALYWQTRKQTDHQVFYEIPPIRADLSSGMGCVMPTRHKYERMPRLLASQSRLQFHVRLV